MARGAGLQPCREGAATSNTDAQRKLVLKKISANSEKKHFGTSCLVRVCVYKFAPTNILG
jgi:hypothetical protein